MHGWEPQDSSLMHLVPTIVVHRRRAPPAPTLELLAAYASTLNAGILEFAVSKLGSRVGNGECW